MAIVHLLVKCETPGLVATGRKPYVEGLGLDVKAIPTSDGSEIILKLYLQLTGVEEMRELTYAPGDPRTSEACISRHGKA